MVFFSSRNSPFDVDGDLLGQVAVGHGGGHFGDVAHLAGEVAGHRVDAVGQVLPGAGHALDLGLAAELAFGADFAGHARHFRGERAELIHHLVDRSWRCAGIRPASGRSSISRAIVCDRSPWATAPMTRAVSLVG